ncbi:MAG: hypothetical protein GWO02_08150 [Gammaproteobacteria bacterium]|nr:hypothetical protein [Gammaproteobacteria bacterium]
MERLVRRSGGRIYELQGTEAVDRALADVLRDLRAQYALGYYPDPRRGDGAWRRVRVTLERTDLRLRAREGYVDR